MKPNNWIKLVAVMITMQACLVATVQTEEAKTKTAETGTDPRDFAPKFMPYYKYTELENGLEQQDFVAFGLLALKPNIAVTYELFLAQERDFTGVDDASPEFEGKKTTGVGDSNVRLLIKTGHWAGGDWLTGVQFNIPTATKDELSSNQFSMGPHVSYVRDLGFWPGPGAFVALMNFYFFDVMETNDEVNPAQSSDDVSMYVGRWFCMLPLTDPAKGWWGGLYLLPEMQPIYDFETDDFSFWIAPEFGKMISPGNIIYAKPGWGISNSEDTDREFTFELGYRLFL